MRFWNGFVLLGMLVALPAHAADKEQLAVVEMENVSKRVQIQDAQFPTDMQHSGGRR